MISAYEGWAASWAAGPELIYEPMADALVACSPIDLDTARVLDLGAGTGVATRAAQRAGAQVIAADLAALRLCRSGETRGEELLRRAAAFRETLRGRGWAVGGESQIVPVVVGESARAVALSGSLADQGFLALPVRPPTVPEGSARLRFSLTAAHTERQVAAVVEELGAP